MDFRQPSVARLQKNGYNTVNIEHIEVTHEEIGVFDVDSIELEVLLFQTGYLTISEKKNYGAKIYYILKYPNQEVRMSLTSVILSALSKNKKVNRNSAELYTLLKDSQLDRIKDIFYSFFASIPHDWYRKNTIAEYEILQKF